MSIYILHLLIFSYLTHIPVPRSNKWPKILPLSYTYVQPFFNFWMKKCIRDATASTVMVIAMKRSAGSDVTFVRGTVALLVCKACRSHTRRKRLEVLNLHQAVNP